MPQPERIVGDWGGPYVQAVYFAGSPPHPTEPELFADVVHNLRHQPEQLGGEPFLLWLTVVLVPGRSRGEHTVEVIGPRADLVPTPLAGARCQFYDDEASTALPIPVPIPIHVAGWHWYDVTLDGRLITRIPLEVVSQSSTDPLGPTRLHA